MLKRFLITVSTAVAVSVSLVLPVSADDGASHGPDFTVCTSDGVDFGTCVADIAQAYRDADVEAGAASATTARSLVDGCAALEGEAFGTCVSTAAQALNDAAAEREDAQAAETAVLAQALVDGCQAEEGADFGTCVSNLAQALGDDMAEDHGRSEDRAPDDAGQPASTGRR